MTRQRAVILQELSRLTSHPTADELYRLVQKRLPKISLATIYRNLESMSAQGLIRKIELAGKRKHFDAALDRHFHVRCMRCGKIEDLAADCSEELERKYQPLTDYELKGCRVEFIGICPDCRSNSGRQKKGTPAGPKRGRKRHAINGRAFEELYRKYNHREFVHPDPLEFLYLYENPLDREIVALVASSLAYGKVAQILKSVKTVLDRMPEPYEFLQRSTKPLLRKTFAGFKHRFTTGDEIASLLYGLKKVYRKYGSLETLFMEGFDNSHENIIPALGKFVRALHDNSGLECCHLLPEPGLGSACKRLNLFLRWMVREDEVDPGGWYNVHPCKLIVPLDIHMHRMGLAMGLTGRKQADIQAALEVTDSFREIAPDDPVRYDFSLTRLGIRDECDPIEIIGRQFASSPAK
jgi:uncharacterized protein (TIGR02757 family)